MRILQLLLLQHLLEWVDEPDADGGICQVARGRCVETCRKGFIGLANRCLGGVKRQKRRNVGSLYHLPGKRLAVFIQSGDGCVALKNSWGRQRGFAVGGFYYDRLRTPIGLAVKTQLVLGLIDHLKLLDVGGKRELLAVNSDGGFGFAACRAAHQLA